MLVESSGVRILCVAECRGSLSRINDIAEETNADVVVHTGSFGFFDGDSAAKMPARALRTAAAFSPVVPFNTKQLPQDEGELRERVGSQLSELPLFLAGVKQFQKPVYAVWGSAEDVTVLEKFHSGQYNIKNLHIIDERTAPLIEGTSIRLMGLGGAFQASQLFDRGSGNGTVAGQTGSVWISLWQIGELIQTVKSTFSANETRLLVTHSSPSQNTLILLLALVLRADMTLSGGLHFRYTASYNDFVADPSLENFERRLSDAVKKFSGLWSQVSHEVMKFLEGSENERESMTSTVNLLSNYPRGAALHYMQEAYKTIWHFNLTDVENGYAILSVSDDGKIGAETSSAGFDFSSRLSPKLPPAAPAPKPASSSNSSNGTSKKKAVKEEPAHALFFRDGDRPEQEILGLLHEDDRKTQKGIVFREAGTRKRAIVVFDSAEAVQQAYQRVNKEEAGTVAVYSPRPHHHTSHRRKGRQNQR